jgi:hypothetical protein
MGGTGYNIPVSVSVADTFSVPQTTNAPTIFAFRGGSFGASQANPSNINPATATSSAAEGGGSAGSASSGSGVSGYLKQGLTTGKALLIGGGVLAVLGLAATIWLMRKRR